MVIAKVLQSHESVIAFPRFGPFIQDSNKFSLEKAEKSKIFLKAIITFCYKELNNKLVVTKQFQKYKTKQME